MVADKPVVGVVASKLSVTAASVVPATGRTRSTGEAVRASSSTTVSEVISRLGATISVLVSTPGESTNVSRTYCPRSRRSVGSGCSGVASMSWDVGG